MEKTPPESKFRIIKIILFVAGLTVFAVFSNQSIPLIIVSFSGLCVSVLIIVSEIHTFKDLYTLFDWYNLSKKSIYYLPVSIVIGLVFGIIYRNYLQAGILPLRFTGFAVIAMAIGSCEELLFRGYLQSQIRKFDVLLSIMIATCAHTAYKLLIFLPYQSEPDIEITFILQWTLLGGLVFALLKEFSQNSVYPVISHALFDLLVYGDNLTAPWWVWA
ncbi:MAG TPA: CPBP family intramembrane glutamic endopeptidase [Bacteroidales bacterium]|nr:CPBP family intramembrane glutamic endopeptidase [Bacteroidales bacterium]